MSANRTTAPAHRTRKPRRAPAAPDAALDLLDQAVNGNRQALDALRARLDLPGPHAGAARSEHKATGWVNASEILEMVGKDPSEPPLQVSEGRAPRAIPRCPQ
jgi:hypothetical protein